MYRLLQEKHRISKHSHGPAFEITRPTPRKRSRRKIYATYTGPDGEKVRLTKYALVMALALDHPEWSDLQIARAASVNRRSLYRMRHFSAIRRMQKGWYLE